MEGNTVKVRIYSAALAALTMAITPNWGSAHESSTLAKVRARGELICGVGTGLAGFALPDSDGNWQGLDTDYCRALAAAAIGDARKVKFVPLTAKDRFAAIQAGQVDVLARTTTWTLSRDTANGLDFRAVDFYDGQGFLVRADSGLTSAAELDGASICLTQGSTAELNTSDYFRAKGMKYKPVTFATSSETVKAYESGRCDSYSNDSSALYGERRRMAEPDKHVVLPEIVSREPLAIGVLQGDSQWSDLTAWLHFALLIAEDNGITRDNVETYLTSENPEIRRLLGVEGNVGELLGVNKDWALRAIRAVGNYGEMYDRNLGSGSPLKIPRGLNALWSKGGLQYAPPLR
ncbi:amino acid ABC transporter substrate-binding protein [Metarhizobium album]|uniref:Amino acid ABC transporter substrate-binding protein n=1 Tax=Metarhizobium album TaxID=2182425 RepID=A0A2U2DJ70_9HYPH|nr:amino acid ABC transporter substrate-binding protein [Rhizobium album]